MISSSVLPWSISVGDSAAHLRRACRTCTRRAAPCRRRRTCRRSRCCSCFSSVVARQHRRDVCAVRRAARDSGAADRARAPAAAAPRSWPPPRPAASPARTSTRARAAARCPCRAPCIAEAEPDPVHQRVDDDLQRSPSASPASKPRQHDVEVLGERAADRDFGRRRLLLVLAEEPLAPATACRSACRPRTRVMCAGDHLLLAVVGHLTPSWRTV